MPRRDPRRRTPAERAMRHPVVRRRTSHRTPDHGRLFVQPMLTAAVPCRLLRRPVFAFARAALLAYRSGLPAPSVLPDPLVPDH